jgi:DNA-3-methyladenine glycosylase
VGAVLIRAVEPTVGLERMKARRATRNVANLASGPGKLCRAFGIDMQQHGRPVGESVRLFQRSAVPEILTSTRIGIRRDEDLPWRFFIAGSPYVSGPRSRMMAS